MNEVKGRKVFTTHRYFDVTHVMNHIKTHADFTASSHIALLKVHIKGILSYCLKSLEAELAVIYSIILYLLVKLLSMFIILLCAKRLSQILVLNPPLGL